MENRAVIRQENDRLVIELPTATLWIRLPKTVSFCGTIEDVRLYDANKYSRAVESHAQKGRFRVLDGDSKELVYYEETSRETTRELRAAAENQGAERVAVTTNRDGYGAAATKQFDISVRRFFTESSARSTEWTREGENTPKRREMTEDPLFATPNQSPEIHARKRKLGTEAAEDEFGTPERKKCIAMVPLENTPKKVMLARERSGSGSIDQNATPHSKQPSIVLGTPDSHSRDPSVKDLATIPPHETSWQKRSRKRMKTTPEPSAQRSRSNAKMPASSSPSASGEEQPPKPHIPFRVPGEQPLRVPYKGTADSRPRSEKLITNGKTYAGGAVLNDANIAAVIETQREDFPSLKRKRKTRTNGQGHPGEVSSPTPRKSSTQVGGFSGWGKGKESNYSSVQSMGKARPDAQETESPKPKSTYGKANEVSPKAKIAYGYCDENSPLKKYGAKKGITRPAPSSATKDLNCVVTKPDFNTLHQTFNSAANRKSQPRH